MIAELMAPIEIPATQSGWRSAQRLVNTRLIGAKGAAALEQQRDTLEGQTGSHAACPISHEVMRGVAYKPASVLDEES